MDRLDPLACAIFVVLAFILAGLLHAFWLRSRWSARFHVPIDGYRTFAGRRIFGDNKTWAGFMSMIPAAGAAFWLLRLGSMLLPTGWISGLWPLPPHTYGLLGCWAGFGFMAGELPNSFCKRQLGIAPGRPPLQPLGRVVSFLVDRLDSIVGAFLALALVIPMSPWVFGYILVVGPGLHWLFSILLYQLGVKARPA